MPIDAFTLLLLCGAIQLLLGALLLFIWLQDRPAAALASWGCAFCFAALAAFPFAKSGLIGDGYVAPASSGAFAIMAFVCFWQGARAFDGQRILWLHSLLPLGLWLLANLEHGFAENVARRLALAALIAFSLTAMTALEFWRGRHEPLQSRWPVMVLFASLSLFLLGYFGYAIMLLSLPDGAPAMAEAIANFVLLCHAVPLAAFLSPCRKNGLNSTSAPRRRPIRSPARSTGAPWRCAAADCCSVSSASACRCACCIWTSTASSRSMTGLAMPLAMKCWCTLSSL
jgi:peptidoglycan/LPS O-acetylase OafA/YrhL